MRQKANKLIIKTKQVECRSCDYIIAVTGKMLYCYPVVFSQPQHVFCKYIDNCVYGLNSHVYSYTAVFITYFELSSESMQFPIELSQSNPKSNKIYRLCSFVTYFDCTTSGLKFMFKIACCIQFTREVFSNDLDLCMTILLHFFKIKLYDKWCGCLFSDHTTGLSQQCTHSIRYFLEIRRYKQVVWQINQHSSTSENNISSTLAGKQLRGQKGLFYR